MSVKIDVKFNLGLGNMIAALVSGGVVVGSRTITTSGPITFPTAKSGDGLHINITATGSATITISCPTDHPPLPVYTGHIIQNFIIL